jgi:hypothetical protein
MCSCRTCGILAKTFSSRKDGRTCHALAATHIGTPWSESEARQSSSTDDIARWRRCEVSARRLLQSFDNGLINNFKRWFENGAQRI